MADDKRADVIDIAPLIRERQKKEQEEAVNQEPVPALTYVLLELLHENASHLSLEEQLTALHLAGVTIQRNVAELLGQGTANQLARRALQLSMQYRPKWSDDKDDYDHQP